MTTTIQHHLPKLQTDVIGELDPDTGLASFRGIPFASVEKRWTHSRVNHSLPSSPFDATKFGARCPQAEGPVLVSGGATDPTPGDDEFKCLNLNICVPKDALPGNTTEKTSSLLPVMFWIHGGGFSFGANSVARYRPEMLCDMGLKAGAPFILVQVGYRLGAFGYAASSDLATELDANDNSPTNVVGSYGQVDQRNALLWVRDHIHEFGGDSSNVTAFGISAGSASVHYHIISGDPLFDRAIMMSGAAPTLGPNAFEGYDSAWNSACENIGLEGKTTTQRIEALRALSAVDLIEKYKRSPMGPVGDDKLLPKDWKSSAPQAATRCKEIILGDTRVESIIFDGLFENLSQARFHETVKNHFSPEDAQDFCKSFGFTSEDLPKEQYRDALRLLFSVVMFQFPNLLIAESYPGDAYLYHFEEPSPYPGPTYGLSYHGQCAIFMYQNENDSYPEPARKVAEELGQIWTAFGGSGKKPWDAYNKSNRFMRFGPGGELAMQDFKSDQTRPYGYQDWLRKHFDETKGLVKALFG